MRSKARLDAAVAAQPFDWDAWNRDITARTDALQTAIDTWNNAESALSHASINMARDVRRMIGEAK